VKKGMEQKFLSQGLNRSQVIRWIPELDQGSGEERVPYEETKPALQFLHETLGIHPFHLLKRGLGIYEKGQLKNIAKPLYVDLLTLKAKTEKALAAKVTTLLSALQSLAVHRMMVDKNMDLEGLVMSPKVRSKEEFESDGHGFVTIEEAAGFLGMKQRAFDLLVAVHRDIFMRMMKYKKMWLIPELYLKELTKKEGFTMVKAKYELLAKKFLEARRTAHPTKP